MKKTKKMKVTIDEATVLIKELNMISSGNISFPTKYKLQRNIDLLKPVVDTLEKMRLELLDKYATINEDGSEYIFNNEDEKELFRQEYLKLLVQEENLEFKYFNLDEFNNIENASNLFVIFKLIED